MENKKRSKMELICELETYPQPLRMTAYWILMNADIVSKLNSIPIPDAETLEKLIQKAKAEKDYDNLVLLYYQQKKQQMDNG